MGLRGPAPKPTALKDAAGNPGRRRLNEGEPIPPPGVIKPPAWVHGQAVEIWAELAPTHIAMRTLTTADVYLFARYCVLLARWVELEKFLYRKGPGGTTYPKKSVRKDGKGREISTVDYVYELPQAAEHRRLSEILMRMEDRLGGSPAARARMQVVRAIAPPPVDPAKATEDAERRQFFAGGGPAAPRKVAGKE